MELSQALMIASENMNMGSVVESEYELEWNRWLPLGGDVSDFQDEQEAKIWEGRRHHWKGCYMPKFRLEVDVWVRRAPVTEMSK